ncbi:MAG: AAA family ATPase, partial [Nitrososphaeraceae archaeon]|nr:AAA family ATPase [Nitrososphaeraceae archaeon]
FSNIVGYSDVKKLLLKSIVSKEPVNILLTGPPSSCKTIFLLEILDALDGTYFMDATSITSAGMIDYLFEHDTKYLLIDEIDKMKAKDQAALLNAMETGIICETKLHGKTRQKKMKLWIFATSNDVDRLSKALRSRFMELHLKEYAYEEFMNIVRKLLKKRYRMDEDISEKIAYAVWNVLNSKDVRDAIRIAKLSKTCSDVDWLVNIKIKYSKLV